MSDAPDTSRYRRLVPAAIASVVFVTALFLVLASAREDNLRDAVRQIDWRIIPLALSLHVAAHLFWAARFTIIAQAAKVPMGPMQSWAIITAGVFGGAVTPGRIGGEGLKLALLLKRVRAGPAGRLLVADRAADLVFFMLLGLVAVVLLPPLFGAEAAAARGFALAGSIMLGLFLVLLATFLWAPQRTSRFVERIVARACHLVRRDAPAIQEHVHRFLEQARAGMVDVLGRRPALAVMALALTLLNWVVEYGAIWVLLRAFGHDVPYWSVFFVGIVLTMVANIPLTPGGTGVAEVAALALLTPLAPNLSPLFVVLWRGLTYNYDLAVGGVTASVLLGTRTHDKG
ncbi:MAG: flippase-like domain-containing protein [Thermoplasmatota archaeon]